MNPIIWQLLIICKEFKGKKDKKINIVLFLPV